jgi:hypothetical protein
VSRLSAQYYVMNVVLLTSFPTLSEQGEALAAITAALGPNAVQELISDIPRGSLVVPRFRAIPFGDLLEREVHAHGSELVNSYHQHRAIADSSTWIHLLGSLTAPAYGVQDMPYLPEGEWFVKGETNSLKNRWSSACYAPTTKDLITVVNNFQNDTFLGNQRVVIKPFVHFRQLESKSTGPIYSLSGQPIWNERRVFVLDGQPVSEGLYWSSFEDEAGDSMTKLDPSAFEAALAEAISKVSHLARFLVIDLAELPDGQWRVIELNDGSMSGLSGNDPRILWANFLQVANGAKSTLVLSR